MLTRARSPQSVFSARDARMFRNLPERVLPRELCAYRQMRSVSGGLAAGFLKHSAQRGSFEKSCVRKPSSIVARNGELAISAIDFSRTLPSFWVPS